MGDRVVEGYFLDLYAGSGNIGIEALSRGAAGVVFVDRHSSSLKLIKENLTSLGVDGEFEIYQRDSIKMVQALGRKDFSFDMIFIDPPYFRGLGEKSIITVAENKILRADGVAIVKHDRKESIPMEINGLKCMRDYDYGDNYLSFYSTDKEKT